MADTTRGSGMGYGIMKSTSHSGGASPHLSRGSQIAQVTSAPVLHTHDPRPHCFQTTPHTLHQDPAATCSLHFMFANVGVTAA